MAQAPVAPAISQRTQAPIESPATILFSPHLQPMNRIPPRSYSFEKCCNVALYAEKIFAFDTNPT